MSRAPKRKSARATASLVPVLDPLRALAVAPLKLIAAVVGVLTIDGVEVVDGGEDGLILVANFVRAAPSDLCVVDLRVVDVGILVLRVAALVAELGVAVDALDVEAADDCGIGWETGDAGHQAGQICSVGALAAVGAGEGEAGVEDRVLIEDVRDATGYLLIEDVDGAVAVAAGRPLNVGRRCRSCPDVGCSGRRLCCAG